MHNIQTSLLPRSKLREYKNRVVDNYRFVKSAIFNATYHLSNHFRLSVNASLSFFSWGYSVTLIHHLEKFRKAVL